MVSLHDVFPIDLAQSYSFLHEKHTKAFIGGAYLIQEGGVMLRLE